MRKNKKDIRVRKALNELSRQSLVGGRSIKQFADTLDKIAKDKPLETFEQTL